MVTTRLIERARKQSRSGIFRADERPLSGSTNCVLGGWVGSGAERPFRVRVTWTGCLQPGTFPDEWIEDLRRIPTSIEMGSAVEQLHPVVDFEMRRNLKVWGAGPTSWWRER